MPGAMPDGIESFEVCSSNGFMLIATKAHDPDEGFKEAKRDRNSPKRSWFVWSDTDKKYSQARVIFIDSEISNWAWEPVTRQYYWQYVRRVDKKHRPEIIPQRSP